MNGNKRMIQFFVSGLIIMELLLFGLQISLNLRIYDFYGGINTILAVTIQQVFYVQIFSIFAYIGGFFIQRLERFTYYPDPKKLTNFELERLVTLYQNELKGRDNEKK